MPRYRDVMIEFIAIVCLLLNIMLSFPRNTLRYLTSLKFLNRSQVLKSDNMMNFLSLELYRMYLINKSTLGFVRGGYASLSSEGIIVTDDSLFSWNGFVMKSSGEIFFNNKSVYDPHKDGAKFKASKYGCSHDFQVLPYGKNGHVFCIFNAC